MHDWGVHGRGHVWQGGIHGGRESHCSKQYASYWNAFLSGIVSMNNRQNGSVTHFESEILCQKFPFYLKHNSVLKGGVKQNSVWGSTFFYQNNPLHRPPPLTTTKAKGPGYQAVTVSFSSSLCFWGKLVIFIPDCAV